MKITFLGAAEEVTGSRYLVEHENINILVDCGLFQGPEIKQYQKDQFLLDAKKVDAIILTHAHIDHSGYIPFLVKNGFKGKIYCSQGTYDLCSILLVDSGLVQEEDAKESHGTAQPLYTKRDAEYSLRFFQVVNYQTPINIGKLKITLLPSGHIIGSSFVIISDGNNMVTFSGDLSGFNQFLMKSPTLLQQTDFLIIESTYGNKLHEKVDALKILAQIINATIAKSGTLIIPSFAVGRAQTILYCLSKLKEQKLIPDIPIFLDSPMAIRASNLLCHFPQELKITALECSNIMTTATYIRTAQESKALDKSDASKIIIAGSGMAEGGRVLHHLKHFIYDKKNTVLFVGFQVEGTLGYDLVHGAKQIKIKNNVYDVHAEVKNLDIFSAHADYQEILKWLESFQSKVKKVFVTHGQPEAAESLKHKIEERFGWSVVVAQYLQSFDLQ
ncbi:MBL fold metallo-hydrolase [Candidatus Dependentiae bacterium]|nr:MBL fold metallo-hydrolase [Candidatus Dependentiae bacterium]